MADDGPRELTPPNKGFLLRAQKYLVLFGIGYFALLGLLTIPYFQLHAIFMHAAKWPLFATFDKPEAYGFAPGKVLNVRIPSTDNATLGAWFVFSEPYYQSLGAFPLPETSHPSLTDIPTAISRRPTVLWLHGNAATRAISYRVALVSALSSRLDANVLAIDYRGYGDSTGVPSERGLVDDAWAAWKWLGERGAREQDVVIVGHSLGTGVGAAFANELVKSGGTARGLTLIAPFSSLATLLDTYYLLGLVPLMRPLEVFPGARQAVKYFLATHFDTSAVLPAISAHMPIVLAHADDDWDIPPTHSETLFERIVAPKLPAKPLPPKPGVDERAQREYEGVLRAYQEHKQMRAYMVKTEKVDRFGVVEKFGMHVLVRTHHGGHNLVGLQEGVQDAMRFAFKL